MNTAQTISREAATVSVVLPVYNEFHALETLVKRISDTLEDVVGRYEILFVNDGSTDGSDFELERLQRLNDVVRVIHFSRNFGHQAAVQAGLAEAMGDAVIVMDSDLQDDPTAIIAFLEEWRQGADVVYAVRVNRKEAYWKRAAFTAFYRLLNRISSVEIPLDAGNFSLLDRRVVETINQLPERDRYFPGLRSWAGFEQVGVEVERCPRYDASPRVSVFGLFRLAKSALFSFSHLPLTLFYLIGGVSFLVCGGLATFALYHKCITGLAVPGWASTTIVVSLFGAINSLGIAILGEYAARIYDQVRARPNYVVNRQSSSATTSTAEVTIPQKASPEAALLEWLEQNWGELGIAQYEVEPNVPTQSR